MVVGIGPDTSAALIGGGGVVSGCVGGALGWVGVASGLEGVSCCAGASTECCHTVHV